MVVVVPLDAALGLGCILGEAVVLPDSVRPWCFRTPCPTASSASSVNGWSLPRLSGSIVAGMVPTLWALHA